MVRYDESTGPSGGPTRGAVALRDHWREVTGLGDMGIYNPRRVRGSRAWSIHASGRAVDFAANANDPSQKAKADDYCAFLIRHAESFQCQYLIWCRRSWKSGRGWRNYTGVSPHTDHVHVELNETGGENLTLSKLRTQWGRDTAQPAPHPEEDTDMHGSDIIASYGEAGYLNATLHPDLLREHWRDIRVWVHAIYAKPEHERAGGVAYVRALLGLK